MGGLKIVLFFLYTPVFAVSYISKNNTLHSERPLRQTHRTPERQLRFRTQQPYHTTHLMQPGAAPNTQDAPGAAPNTQDAPGAAPNTQDALDAAHNTQDALDAVPNTQDAI